MKKIKVVIKFLFHFIRRFFISSLEKQLYQKNNTPISRKFAFDLGTPIDRVYTNDFLGRNSSYIQGIVCEIAENTYTLKFGKNIQKSEILHINPNCTKATIIADLTKHEMLPENYLDCFIVTVTLNFIYDYKKAIQGIYKMLKPGGIALISVAGLMQISRYDYDKWGDYWRFTDMGINQVVEEIFGNVIEKKVYGNLYASMCALQGIPAEKLSNNELFYFDSDYQILITLVAKKNETIY